jgi:hypothetical protein
MSKKFVQEVPRDKEDSALLLCVMGPSWNILGVGFCFLGGWSKRDIKVRFGSPHNPPAFFSLLSPLHHIFLGPRDQCDHLNLMKPYE